MAANSKHQLDVLQWVYNVIYSCTTPQQSLSAHRLVVLYIKKFPYKVYGDKNYIDHEVLREISHHHLNETCKH